MVFFNLEKGCFVVKEFKNKNWKNFFEKRLCFLYYLLVIIIVNIESFIIF